MSFASMSKRWYLFIQDKYYGPYTKEQLVSFSIEGRIMPTDHIWDAEAEEWITAAQVDGLIFKDGFKKENVRKGKFKGLKAVVLISIALLAIAAGGFLLNTTNNQSKFIAQEGFNELIRSTVGPEGGVLHSKDNEIRLEIPAGALAQEAEIIIAVNEQPDIAGPNQASDLYEITGLEQTYKPLGVKIKTTATLAGETYATLGRTGYFFSGDRWDLSFSYHAADINGETVSFTIPPHADAYTSPEPPESFSAPLFTRVASAQEEAVDRTDTPILAAVITNQQSAVAAQNRFNIIAPGDISTADITQITQALEYSYNFFKSNGFRDDWGRHQDGLIYKAGDWPLDVYIKDYGEIEEWWLGKADGFFVMNWGLNDAHLELNAKLVREGSAQLWTTIMHEYCHLIQFLHGVIPTTDQWFCEMMAIWSEEFAWFPENKVIWQPNQYREHALNPHRLFILDGPINHSRRDNDHHGYGSWPYLRYLVREPEDSSQLASVLDKIYLNQYPNDLAILEDIRPGIPGWINDFYVELTTGVLPNPAFGHPSIIFDSSPRLEYPTPVVTLNLDSGLKEGSITHRQALEIPGYGARGIFLELDTTLPPEACQDMALTLTSCNTYGIINLIELDVNPAKLLEGEASRINLNSLEPLVASRRSHQALVLVTNTSPRCRKLNIDFTVTERVTCEPEMADITGDYLLTSTVDKIHYQEDFEFEGRTYTASRDLGAILKGNFSIRKNEQGILQVYADNIPLESSVFTEEDNIKFDLQDPDGLITFNYSGSYIHENNQFEGRFQHYIEGVGLILSGKWEAKKID